MQFQYEEQNAFLTKKRVLSIHISLYENVRCARMFLGNSSVSTNQELRENEVQSLLCGMH